MTDTAALIERLRREIFDERPSGPGLRYTQDSPILPDIWEAFVRRPDAQVDLILSPFKGENAGAIVRSLRADIDAFEDAREARLAPEDGETGDRPPRRAAPRIAHIPGLIVASLYFDHLVTLVLPSTRWWSVRMGQLSSALRWGATTGDLLSWPAVRLPRLEQVGDCMARIWTPEDAAPDRLARYRARDPQEATREDEAPYDLLKLIRIVGIMELSRRGDLAPKDDPTPEEILNAFGDLFRDRVQPLGSHNTIWGGSLNRPAKMAVQQSTKAMKADAGRRLFDLTGDRQRWAIVDSGIDGRHPAFSDWRRRNPSELSASETPRPAAITDRDARPSRVLRTYEFDGLRELLDASVLRDLCDDIRALAQFPDPRQEAQAALEAAEGNFGAALAALQSDTGEGASLADIDSAERRLRVARSERARAMGARRLLNTAALRQTVAGDPLDVTAEISVVEALLARLSDGLEVDWGAIETLIEDVDPPAPLASHGTNVAAILGANWREKYGGLYASNTSGVYPAMAPEDGRERLCGVCPDIELMDFRVVTETDDGVIASHDFEVIAALKLIHHLNSRSDGFAIHGANLSIAIEHNVRNFACGRTPVCEESDRVVASGVVIVSAAGNSGYSEASDLSARFYRHASISDPGNAEAVITVGSTHRSKPHEYGVSYFSSRGPTGDGRRKPDLVAPGEKIRTATPGAREAIVDGTSFSAPHVAGAAALLMQRHTELVGQPQRIKAILCSSATDLGRERDFQGAGMLDVLRALQSI